MKKKAFTLIELIAVLVILAILALIVTPLVMNIIRKARISADKRSIDAYGRSIELAIATYLLDEGKFPTSIDELTIEYSGDRVVCETSQLNSDSSVYLALCRVSGRLVDYTYGDKKTPAYESYSVGDLVTYNNIDYYVIKDSDESEANVTLLKKEPLTVAEVNLYGGVGTENNHVNHYTTTIQGAAKDSNGYGSMAYYSSSTCGCVNHSIVNTECTNIYVESDIKYVVDSWKNAQAPAAIETRLLTTEDLMDNLGYNWQIASMGMPSLNDNVLDFAYNSKFNQWTMTSYNDSVSMLWLIRYDGNLNATSVYDEAVVRPVIVLSKSVI